jgi:predicted CoA-binding protein
MDVKTTLVLGASPKEDRYSNKAVRRLLAAGHPVIAVGHRVGSIGDQPIRTDIPEAATIHTVTLYLNPHNQEVWTDRILHLKPQRIIFNPGTENAELEERATENGIEVVEGCTLVMLGTGQF